MSNNYAFDDCSILHLCKLKPRKAYHVFVGSEITFKNWPQLQRLLDNLRKNNLAHSRFVPAENFDDNVIKSYGKLLEGVGNVQILGNTFKKEILEQLQKFYDEIKKEFAEIEKETNIQEVKELVEKNEVELEKGRNIPNEDDLSIIAGYSNFTCEGRKYLISEDEDF